MQVSASGTAMNIGVVLPILQGWPDLRDFARFAEEIGVDSLWVPDGFSNGSHEALTNMSAVAASTEHIEVGAYMLNASLRDLALLAKMAATLDHLAPGRIRILLGTGWDRSDYEALGSEFPSPDVRTQRTRDALSILKGDTRVSVEVAGVRDDVLKLAAAGADGWSLSADALDAYFERVEFLRRACDESGRRFGDLRLSCTLPLNGGTVERVSDLMEHGMQEFRIALPDGADGRDHLKQLVAMIRPRTVSASARATQDA